MWQLAAPQTWAATIAAIMYAFAYSMANVAGRMDLLLSLVLLAVCFLMQSSANVFNDYYDYVKGTDTKENSSEDRFDAVLVYNNVNPNAVLAFAIVLLALAALGGGFIVWRTGWVPLVIGLVGAAVVVFYSFGKTPISHLPIGEGVIGIVMGGLVPLACSTVLMGRMDWVVLVGAIPVIIGIALILATNNTCDIEKDSSTTRRTLPLLLGRSRAVKAYRFMAVSWLASIVVVSAALWPSGLLFSLLAVVAVYPAYRALLRNPLVAQTRDASMAQVTMLNVLLGGLYAAACLSGSLVVWLL